MSTLRFCEAWIYAYEACWHYQAEDPHDAEGAHDCGRRRHVHVALEEAEQKPHVRSHDDQEVEPMV